MANSHAKGDVPERISPDWLVENHIAKPFIEVAKPLQSDIGCDIRSNEAEPNLPIELMQSQQQSGGDIHPKEANDSQVVEQQKKPWIPDDALVVTSFVGKRDDASNGYDYYQSVRFFITGIFILFFYFVFCQII